MASKQVHFELSRLTSYDDASIKEELRRVAALLPTDKPYTAPAFDQHARVASCTVRRRFGGWLEALKAVGLEDRYSGRTVTRKMRKQAARDMSDEDIIAELKRVARVLSTDTLTIPQFNANSCISASAISRRFNSWNNGLQLAGLKPTTHGRRYTKAEYFENLLMVWTHLGRQPTYGEMNQPPSCITSGAYEKKWGTWSKALLAFVERVNSDMESESPAPVSTSPGSSRPKRRAMQKSPRSIPLGVRYNILKRDHFKCVLCGNSPAIDPLCTLHVDHIIPVARGGSGDIKNLRSLCQPCNLGKSNKSE